MTKILCIRILLHFQKYAFKMYAAGEVVTERRFFIMPFPGETLKQFLEIKEAITTVPKNIKEYHDLD